MKKSEESDPKQKSQNDLLTRSQVQPEPEPEPLGEEKKCEKWLIDFDFDSNRHKGRRSRVNKELLSNKPSDRPESELQNSRNITFLRLWQGGGDSNDNQHNKIAIIYRIWIWTGLWGSPRERNEHIFWLMKAFRYTVGKRKEKRKCWLALVNIGVERDEPWLGARCRRGGRHFHLSQTPIDFSPPNSHPSIIPKGDLEQHKHKPLSPSNIIRYVLLGPEAESIKLEFESDGNLAKIRRQGFK